MRKIVAAASLIAAFFSTTAHARSGEGSAELRVSGVANKDGAGLVGGIGLGMDWSLGEKFSIGTQATGEISSEGDFGIITGVIRAGPKLGERSKLYVLGGVAAVPDLNDGKTIYPVAGAGVDVGIGKRMYVKAEYRLFPGTDTPDSEGDTGTLNQITLGVGIRF